MNTTTCPKEYVDFINILAEESSKILLKYFRTKLKIDSKIDNTPVTIADKECESLIRDIILKKYPKHGILGEEHKDINPNNEFVWVIDPIDGTRSFIGGHKDFGTLIALLHNKKPILGIINCPAHQERWIGINNLSTTFNGNIVNTSGIKKLKDSYVLTSGLYFDDKIFRTSFEKIIERAKYYSFGGDCYMYGMLATGLIDIVIEDTLKIWDYMALIPVIEGAGGVVTDKYNKKITLDSKGSIIATANPELHNEVTKLLN